MTRERNLGATLHGIIMVYIKKKYLKKNGKRARPVYIRLENVNSRFMINIDHGKRDKLRGIVIYRHEKLRDLRISRARIVGM